MSAADRRSPSSPRTLVVHPTSVDATLLKDIASCLDNDCHRILVSIQHVPYVPDSHVLLHPLLASLGKAIPDVHSEAVRLVKIRQEKGVHQLAADTRVSWDDFVSFHDGKANPISPHDALNMFSVGGLRSIYCTSSANGALTLHCLERPQVSFPPLLPSTRSYSPSGVPSLEEWHHLWAAWDLVTIAMIPQEMLHHKPIHLRHKCLFYIAHIPTFLDILMSRALKEPNTEPKNFALMFERGVDPNIDYPEDLDRHMELPEKDEDWPTLDSIIAFRDRVRDRLKRLYAEVQLGTRALDRHLARMLALTYEHEGWHVETLLYMVIQRAGTGTLPPPGFTSPPWDALAEQWDATPPPSTPTVTLGPATITLGHEDCEGDDFAPGFAHAIAGHAFGWDNESPARVIPVQRVTMEWRPVTNAQFLAFYNDRCHRADADVALPASWVESAEGIQVRTVHGPVPFAIAQHWPVLASHDALAAYARSKGGRLPTEPELRLFLDTYEVGHGGGANVGFRNWHPVPATTGRKETGGRGSNGGVWEWTSTVFRTHEGLFPTAHFPGYSTDFFDGTHNVALGASYVTIPRLAGRRTARNFHQRDYPYSWTGARVVYDS